MATLSNSQRLPAAAFVQRRTPPIHGRLLLQIALCAVPAMALVGFGKFGLAAYTLFGTLLVLLGYHTLEGHGPEVLSLVVGCVPVMMLLRGLFVYNSLQVIMAVSVGVMVFCQPQQWKQFKSDTLLLSFIGASTTYWLASVLMTGDYSSNFRILELSLAAANVRMLAGYRSYLATAFLGLAVSALAIACGLMPYGPRLGITEGQETSIGNPIALGLAASVSFLLAIADGGQWILLKTRPFWRIVLNLLMGAALVLSTSRGSWLVTIIALVVILLCSPRSRGPMLASMALFAVMVAGILQTERGPVIMHYVDNAIGDDKSLDKRTTGRADQWESFPRIFEASPLFGFGPGSGKKVSLEYTKEGKTWHSIYLWIGVELGMLGLGLLLCLIAALFYRSFCHLNKTGEVLPLVGIVGAMMIGISVSGIDAITGVFFGIAFLGNDLSNFRVLRTVTMVPGPARPRARSVSVGGRV